MKLLKTHLHNWCQHEDVTIDFTGGINGIFGKNGSGKSNIMRGVFFSLTGDCPNVGVKTDDLRYGTDGGFVETEFLTVDGERAVIRRQIKTSSCTLKVGDKRYGKASDVDAALYPILGMTKEVLSQYIFVHQEKIDAVIFERPAERNKAFQKMFGTWCCEERREQLQQELARVQVVSYTDRIEELRLQLDTVVSSSLSKAVNVREESAGKLVKIKEDDLRRKMELHASAELEVKRTIDLKTQVDQFEASRAVAAQEIVVEDARIATIAGELSRIAADLPALQERQKVLVAASQRYMMKTSVMSRVDAALEESRRSLPTPPATPREHLVATDKEIQSMYTTRDINQRMLASIGTDGKCSFCQSVLLDVEKQKNAATILVGALNVEIPQRVGERSRLASSWLEYDKQQAQYAEWEQSYTRRIAALQQELLGVSDALPVPDEQLNQVSGQLQRYAELTNLLNSARNACDRARQREMSLTTELVKRRGDLERLNELSKSLMDFGQYEAVRKELLHADTLKRTVAEKDGEIRQLEEQRTQLSQRLKDLQEKEESMKGTRKYFDLITRCRGVLHRDVLPNRVAQKYRAALNGKIFKYLQFFEAPFTCSLRPDLSFVCEFNDGMTQPAERLSGGQRVVLAVAFRFAVNELFASKLGLLALDEPTAWLDDGNTTHIANVLSKARDMTKSGSLQIVVITHAEKLKDVCDMAYRIQ